MIEQSKMQNQRWGIESASNGGHHLWSRTKATKGNVATRPRTTSELSGSESSFARLLQDVGFGRIECLQIHNGGLVLDPLPTVVRLLKFGLPDEPALARPADFELKKPLADFFEYIRSVDEGVIRRLDVHHGLPFSMEIQYCIPRGMSDVKEAHVEAV
jgi:hypothetical protein